MRKVWKGTNAPQGYVSSRGTRAEWQEWGKRWIYVLDEAVSAGLQVVRVDPWLRFLDGPTVYSAVYRDTHRWMATTLAERGLTPLLTLVSFVSNEPAWRAIQSAATGESDAAVNAGWVSQTWSQGGEVREWFWDSLILQHAAFLENFLDAFDRAGGNVLGVMVQLENEMGLPPDEEEPGKIPPDFSRWMDKAFAYEQLAALMPIRVSPSFWSADLAFVNKQMSSISGDWIRECDLAAINIYTAAGITYQNRWAEANVRRIRELTAPVVAKFRKGVILTENAPDGLAEASRESYRDRGLDVLSRRSGHEVEGTIHYTLVATPEAGGTNHAIKLYGDSIFASADEPDIPETE